nr:hypothetical protein [Candidatus Microthrix sp.]
MSPSAPAPAPAPAPAIGAGAESVGPTLSAPPRWERAWVSR